MKKFFLAALFMTAFTLQSHAQEIHFGGKAGVNFASFTGDDADGFDGRTAFHIGLAAELGITDKFSIQPELLYSAQGGEFQDIDIDIDYLTLPVLAKYYAAENFSIEAGPQFGFKVNEGDNVDAESFDLGIAAGLGYKLNDLFFQGRYVFGLSDVGDGGDIKNGLFQISIGYWFF